jgi:type III pantothenate kinase
MILEIDVGNTFLKWRLRAGTRVVGSGRHASAAVDELPLMQFQSVDAVLVGSVAGESVNETLRQTLERYGLPSPWFAATAGTACGVTNSYAKPETMGVDRWLAMLAAWRRLGVGCCVVDSGSAITIDLLDDQGVHQGGFILPGMRLLQKALLGNTARVFLNSEEAIEQLRPANNTSDAVAQGAGFILEGVAMRLDTLLGSGLPLLITGGDGPAFRRLMGRGLLVPELVMDGLQLAYVERTG